MSLVNVQVYYLLEELVECLVTVGDYEGPLVWEVVVDVVYYLHCNVSLSCACQFTVKILDWKTY